jgi:hypothetical protein
MMSVVDCPIRRTNVCDSASSMPHNTVYSVDACHCQSIESLPSFKLYRRVIRTCAFQMYGPLMCDAITATY